MRRGITLVEVLVAFSVIMVFALLSVVAILRVRESAVCHQSKNNLRQIVTAIHGFASAQNGALPTIDGFGANNAASAMSFYASLSGHLGAGDSYQVLVISPADPTVQQTLAAGWETVVSYGANARVFVVNPRIPETFPDGASNTVALAEHYGKCGGIIFTDTAAPYPGITHRPSFCDFDDVRPMTSGNPPVSVSDDSAMPSVTFQAAPRVADCLPYFAQTPHPSGMLTAFADGSVRQLSPGIAPHVYWALITPAGGEAVEVPD